MKAKIKPLIILIAVFIVTLAAGVIAGCSIGEKTAKQLAEERGLTCSVTYYANEGNFLVGGSATEYAYKTIYYKPGSPVFNIGVMSVSANETPLSISRTDYMFNGWYYCALDESGHPLLTDLDGNPLEYYQNGSASMTYKSENGEDVQRTESQKKFKAIPDTSKGKFFEDGNDKINVNELYLVADWVPDGAIEYRLALAEDDQMTVKIGEKEETWTNGQVINTTKFDINRQIVVDPTSAPQINTEEGQQSVACDTHTFINLYFDEECTDPVIAGVNNVIDKPTDGVNKIIYVKYLEGSWTPVRNFDGAKAMLGADDGGNYFVVNDIDGLGMSMNAKVASLSDTVKPFFNAHIDGNGKTISNFKLSVSTSSLKNDSTISMFGEISATASIKNLTLKDIAYGTEGSNISLGRNSVSFYAVLADLKKDGETVATFDNFHIDGLKAYIAIGSASINNIPSMGDGNYNKANWLYGAYFTDAAFTAAHGEIVSNAEIYIK